MALKNDMTAGSVNRHILQFAFPLIVSNVFQALYNLVDMLFVSAYVGTQGVSAVTVCGTLMNVLLMTVSGLSVGVMVVVARYSGQGKYDEVANFANTAIGFYAVLAGTLSVICFLLTPQILYLVRTPAEAFADAQAYLRTIFAGMIFTFGYNLISVFQRGLGDSKSSMFFIIVAAVVNTALDFIFLHFFQMGTFGAALATIIAQAVSFLMGVAYFKINRHLITFDLRSIRLEKRYIRELLKTGLPTAVNQFLLSLSLSTMSGIANSFGLHASAGYGIRIKVDSFAYLPADAVGVAVSTCTSQNLGANQPERAVAGLKTGLKFAISISAVIAAGIFLLSPMIAAGIDSTPEVIRFATTYNRIDCISYLFFASTFCLTGFLRGSNNAHRTVQNVIMAQYVLRLPTAFLLTRLLGFMGIPIAMTIAPAFSTLNYLSFLLRGKWKKRAGLLQE